MIEILQPRSQTAWHRLRKKDVTASVIGALVGVHEYTTAFDVWLQKTGREVESYEETEPMRRGRLLEPVAVTFLREERPAWKIEHNSGDVVRYFRHPHFRIGATPDVIAYDPDRGNGIVQIKSVEPMIYRRKWIAGADAPEPPLWIALQATVEAWLTGSQWAAVAPLVIGQGIELPIIDIPILPGVLERLQAESLRFWEIVESGADFPADYSRDAGSIDRLYYADDGGEVDLSKDPTIHDLIAARADAKTRRADADADLQRIDAEIKDKMRSAAVAHIGGGEQITWKTYRKIGPDGMPSAYRILKVPTP